MSSLLPAVGVFSWAGRGGGQRFQDFLQASGAYDGASPPKKARVFLQECAAVAKDRLATNDSLLVKEACGGRKPVNVRSRRPSSCLLRRSLNQGAPYKCPVIREYLFDWFVDIRRSVCGRLSPKLVLMKARSIADEVLQTQRATGHYTPLPKLDRNWLLRWKRDKGIVFRKPNQRFKTSRQTMIARLRAMWLNTIRIRRLGQIFLGSDLADRVYSVDEKPLHFNEAASKCRNTLEFQGAPFVRLKENHAASRERVSVMTCASSSLAAINQPGGLPVWRNSGLMGATDDRPHIPDVRTYVRTRGRP